MEGVIKNFRRGRTTQKTNHMIIYLDESDNREKASIGWEGSSMEMPEGWEEVLQDWQRVAQNEGGSLTIRMMKGRL